MDGIKRRGRPKQPRRVSINPEITYFKPRGVPLSILEVVSLTLEELESIKLIDLSGHQQEEAASIMGISRRALWEELRSARNKIADALINGKAIEISGGSHIFPSETIRQFQCRSCGIIWEEEFGTGRPESCPECSCNDFCRINR